MEIELNADLFQFVIAGRALFTLEGTTRRFTYRVSQKADDPNTTFVALLTGPNNERDYTCIGLLTGPEKRLVHTRKVSPETPSFKAFAWTFERLRRGMSIAPVKFFHHGACARCGRTLTTPESILRGIGPECAERMA